MFVAPFVGIVQLRSDCFIWPDDETGDFMNHPTMIRKCVWDNWAVVSICSVHLILFSVSFVANSFMYVRIVRTLSRRKHISSSMSRDSGVSRTRTHVARMLGINALVFFICLAPYQLINIADVVFIAGQHVIFDSHTYDTLVWIGRFAVLLNSTIITKTTRSM